MNNDPADEVLEEIQLSRTYTLVLARSTIGYEPALALKVRHAAADGVISYRGGFLIVARKLDEVIDALQRARMLP